MRRLRAALPLGLAIAVAACGGTPGEDKPSDQPAGTPAESIKTDGFEELGPVTLNVISGEGSGGPREALRELTRQFEAKYPNVTVKISFRDTASWFKQARLVAAGENPPDVFAGNQGYQVDGELVKAGRVPASLETFADFEGALATLREQLPEDEPVIALGNKDQYGAIHLWGGIQGAYTPAQDVRDWIFHKDGATFDTEGNLTSLKKLKEWADKGYLGAGDAFNARNDSEAAAAFGKGEGALMIGGNWNAATAKDGLGDDAAFFNMPPGESGDAVAIGSASLPMHVSAKAEEPDLAAAYLDFITGPTAGQALVDTQQVPAATDGTAEPGDPLGKAVKQGWDE